MTGEQEMRLMALMHKNAPACRIRFEQRIHDRPFCERPGWYRARAYSRHQRLAMRFMDRVANDMIAMG